MTDLTEIKEILVKQDKKLDDIHFSIYGNKEAGIKGIACFVQEHNRYIQRDKKIKWIGLGVVSAGGVSTWELIKNYLHL